MSLAIQVTDECIKKYHYLTEASRMTESFKYLQVRLQMELQRFLSFAFEAGLLFADGELCATLKVNQAVLEGVLVEIKTSMEAFEMMQEQYGLSMPKGDTINWDDHVEPRKDFIDLLCANQGRATKHLNEKPTISHLSRLQGIVSLGTRASLKARKLRVILTEPKRLLWASVDKESLEALVSRLESLNSYLISLLDATQIARLERSVENSYMEMLQLRNDLKNLKILVEALAPYDKSNRGELELTAPASDETEKDTYSDLQNKRYLKKLTTIKMDRIEMDATAQHPVGCYIKELSCYELDMSAAFHKHALDKGAGKKLLEERKIFTWESSQVWVEWLGSPSSRWIKAEESHITEARISSLAGLLRKGLPLTFRTPLCRGYAKSGTLGVEIAFGLVFERPAMVNQPSTLITLRELLGNRPKPSLSKRIELSSSLSECVQSFHSVSWLHKGLRSDNIIFICEDVAQVDLSKPYVTGFELSRPSNKIEMTVKPESDLLRDLYRHPRAQSGEEDNPYRKCYDIYSLGVLFLEIIYWRPIEDILQLQPPTIRRSIVRLTQHIRLGKEDDDSEDDTSNTLSHELMPARSVYLDKAAQRGGDTYRVIVELCLSADEIERPVYWGEPVAAIDRRLRAAFHDQVVTRLQLMKEALKAAP
ncbi:hypothetical protein HJFPF1_09446 [Paramyrothecium foliicola]|nr:hypothetical protein HJFPF1_09446 [Paramyrothecium foliicola]